MTPASFFSAKLNAPATGNQSRHEPNRARRRNALRAAGVAVPDGLSVLLALSGGGTRAAALAYGALKALDGAGLLDAVDVISSVSGGSFTAAYYGLFGRRVFSDFERDFLHVNIQRELIARVCAPWNWPRLLSPRFDRIDLAAERYESIFSERTFAQLPERAPFLVLNATDMAIGARFSFIQDRFDLLGSDLSTYSVARAVAASSAFPFLLSPLTLKNYGAPSFNWDLRFGAALQNVERNFDRFQDAQAALSYRDSVRKPWVHLLDGGLADNVGASHVVDMVRGRTPQGAELLVNLGKGDIDRLLVVVVNAKTVPADGFSKRRRAPGLVGMALATATIPLNNYTDQSAMAAESVLRELQAARIAAWQREAGEVWTEPAAEFAIRYPVAERIASAYVVHITLAAIKDDARRARAMALGTNFHLSEKDVAFLRDVAGELLADSGAYQEFRKELSGETVS